MKILGLKIKLFLVRYQNVISGQLALLLQMLNAEIFSKKHEFSAQFSKFSGQKTIRIQKTYTMYRTLPFFVIMKLLILKRNKTRVYSIEKVHYIEVGYFLEKKILKIKTETKIKLTTLKFKSRSKFFRCALEGQ